MGDIRRATRSSRTGRTTARRSTRSGGCCSSGSSGCSRDAPAANISTGSTGSACAAKRHSRFPRGSATFSTRATGWRIVAVPGLVPDDVFFAFLARRRFPSTCFIRRRDQLDYLQEPDVFHDVCGHVPMLMNPVFADYMQAYGEGGLKALRLGHLEQLARLYWYTVEFGLIATPQGCASTAPASSPRPANWSIASTIRARNRLRFDLRRVMRTRLPHRPLSGDLLRHRRFRAAVRGDAAGFRADLSRDRDACRRSRLTTLVHGDQRIRCRQVRAKRKGRA